MERRITSVLFEKLLTIIEKDRPIFDMALEMMQELYEVLMLKSISMLGSGYMTTSSIILSIPESSQPFFQDMYSANLMNQDSVYFDLTYKDRFFYGFQLPEFGNIILEPQERLHPLFITELGNIIHFLADYFSAINDRNVKKKLEVELLKEKALLRTIIDAIPETIAFKDMNETYQLTNKKTNLEYKDRFDSIEGKTISEIYPEYERPIVRALDEEVVRTNSIVRKEVEILTDKGYVSYDTIRTPVYDSDNQMIGIISIGRDISESVQMKEKLKRNSEFQEILVKIATNFINTDIKNFDVVINEALEQIGKFIHADRSYVFTYDFEKGITSNTHEWCNEGVSKEIENLQNMPIQEFVTEWVDIHKQGKEVYIPNVSDLDHESVLYQILVSQNIRSVISVPFMSEGKPIGFVGFDDVKDDRFWNDYEIGLLKVLAEILTNLFERKDREKELIEARIQAEKANEAKTDFLANMSHEIRTPLSGIYNSFYLLNATDLSNEQLDYIDIGYSSVDSLSIIVNSILDLSKIEAEKLELVKEPCNLENELYKIIRIQSYSAEEKNLELQFHYDYRINNQVLIDSSKLRQIVLNLVNNAIKFTLKGSIELKVELIEQTPDSYMTKFSVIDTGIGISKENLSKITNKFFQVDSTVSKKYAGTGLGLTIANGLIHLFGGELEISSFEDQGSVFSFIIPIQYNCDEVITYPKLQDKSVLLITFDNEPCMMLPIVKSLCTNTHVFKWNQLEEIYQQASRYDIVMINSRNPIHDKHEIEKMKKTIVGSQAIFVLCCDNFSSEQVSIYLSYGFQLFIGKNSTRDHIYNKITSLMDQNPQNKENHPLIQKNKEHDSEKHRILIVDDNKLNRKALGIILSKHGYFVDEAESGEIALNKVEDHDYSMILMDVQMPGMSGIEATKRMRQMNKMKTIPIIAVTAHAFQSDFVSFKNEGMDDVLTKPIKIDSLIGLLNKYIHFDDQQMSDTKMMNIPVELKCFDQDDFLYRFEGYDELAMQVIETFMQEYPADVSNIHQAVASMDEIVIENKAHYFKGSVEYLSAKRLVWILNKMIEDARKSILENMEFYNHIIDKEVNELISRLRLFIEERTQK